VSSLGHSHLSALTLFTQHPHLIAAQVARVFGITLRRAQALLHDLAQGSWVVSQALPRPQRTGSSPLCYRLGKRGRQLLLAQGYDLPDRDGMDEDEPFGWLFLTHSLGVSDLLMTASLTQHPQIRLEGGRHEHFMERFLAVPVPRRSRPVGVRPDAWLDFTVAGEQYFTLWELDRGTVGPERWKAKVALYCGAFAGTPNPVEVAYGTQSCTVCVVCTGPRRRTALLRWTQETLRSGSREMAGFFLFSEESPLSHRLFVDAVWHSPFGSSPLALFGDAVARQSA
jgi:hypothetical protein